MKLNVREYLKISIIYAIVTAFPPALQILILPLLEGKDRLGATQFSHLAITESISVLAMTIAIFAMGNAIARFYFDYRDNRKSYNSMVSSVYSSILFRGLILMILAALFGNYIGKIFPQPELRDFSSYGYLAIIVGINRAIFLTATSLYRNEKKIRLFVALSLALGILRTAFQLTMVLNYKMNFIGYLTGSAIGGLLPSLFILGLTFYRSGFHYNRTIMRPIYTFTRPLFQYGLVQWGLLFADRYFLKLNNFQEELGMYDTAMKFVFGIQLILQGIQGAVQPEVYRVLKDRDEETKQNLDGLLGVLQVQTQLIIAIAIIPVMFFLHNFFETKLQLAAGLISLLFMTSILKTQFVIYSFPFYYEKRTKYFLKVNTIVLIINILLNFLLVPIFKAYGSIIALYVSGLVQVIATFYYQDKVIDIKFNELQQFYYPLALVFLTILLEWIKWQFNLNYYITAIFLVIVMLAGVCKFYKDDIRFFLRKQ